MTLIDGKVKYVLYAEKKTNNTKYKQYFTGTPVNFAIKQCIILYTEILGISRLSPSVICLFFCVL